jgi:hypothetical protein
MNDTPFIPKNENICPFIGLSTDALTAMENPSPQNNCHKSKPLSPPSLAYQREFCLNVTYTRCKLFSTDVRKPIPSDLAEESTKKRKRIPGILWILSGIILLGVILVSSGLFSAWFLSPLADKGITPTAGIVSAIKITAGEPSPQGKKEEPEPEPADQGWMAESTLVIESQVQPTTGLTPITVYTEDPPHLLLTPFGTEHVFLLHRVTGGEDLNAIANKYQTSTEAIRAINYNMTLELWVDTVIIIPVNQTDVTGITPMITLEITGNAKTVQELATENGISPELLGAVNARSTEYIFQIGEWVIIPNEPPSPIQVP